MKLDGWTGPSGHRGTSLRTRVSDGLACGRWQVGAGNVALVTAARSRYGVTVAKSRLTRRPVSLAGDPPWLDDRMRTIEARCRPCAVEFRPDHADFLGWVGEEFPEDAEWHDTNCPDYAHSHSSDPPWLALRKKTRDGLVTAVRAEDHLVRCRSGHLLDARRSTLRRLLAEELVEYKGAPMVFVPAAEPVTADIDGCRIDLLLPEV